MSRISKHIFNILKSAILMLIAIGCSPTRHVPEGSYLLDNVKIEFNDSAKALNHSKLASYIRTRPNHKLLWSTKFRLGLYNLSGKDTTKWWNQTFRKLGEPPVIYNAETAQRDAVQLRKALVNSGYLNAEVEMIPHFDNKKQSVDVEFALNAGTPHRIRSIEYEFPNDTLRLEVMADSAKFTLKPGMILDRSLLETERELITTRMRNKGFFAFGKEFITFNADTTAGSTNVDLTLTLQPPYPADSPNHLIDTHKRYIINNIYFITDYEPTRNDRIENYQAEDTVQYRDITILYGANRYLRPSVLYENCFIAKGKPYRLADVNNTYTYLGRLNILKFINIRFIPAPGRTGDDNLLNAYILLTPGKSQSLSAEVEGTNSEGDLGVALGLSYTHRNIGNGSETLSMKVRGAYESLSGDIGGLIHNRYLETGGELGINFPKFKAPFLKESFKRAIKASTEFNASMNYQERPEYTRIISTAGWSYKWSERFSRNRHTFTPFDLNYVYLPESTNNFLDQIAPDNPLLRYSYEDHFIMRMGYSFYYSNKTPDMFLRKTQQRHIFTLRVNAETAGNSLFLASKIFDSKRDYHTNPYELFGIHYSQYAKLDADFAYLRMFDERNSLAFHFGAGIGVPYGNSTILPFEKRFYGGGANGVRGWSVRTLGPGRYPGSNSVVDFINQCGDIRLDMSVEYRPKLFWIMEGALFIDAGNIWTIRNYVNQPYGVFRFNSFYKEIAAAYGAGLRLDFNFFLLRFDLGLKAYNPAIDAYPWPILHPKWSRDASFHFSIGYPF